MKTRLFALLSTVCTLSAMGAYEGPSFAIPGVTYPGGNGNLRNQYSSGANNWGQNLANTYSGSWVFEEGIKNEVYGGSATFSRGDNLAGNTELYVHGNVSGYIAAIVHNSGQLSALNTLVDLGDGVTLTSSKRAIMMRDNHGNNNSLGNWVFRGGNYIGGGNSQAAMIQRAGTITFDSVSFVAGGDGLAAVDIGPSSGLLTIANSRNRTDIVYEASDASSKAFAAPGLAMDGTANISGGYASFIGSQDAGGNRLDESTTDNVSGQSTWAAGGSGALISGGATINGGSYSFIAGDAGNALSGGDSSVARAYGGHGIAAGTIGGTISNSTFRGASAGEAEIVKIDYLTGPETYAESALNAKAYAFGGSGILKGGGALTLIDSEAKGSIGGSASSPDTGGYADSSGGDGVTAGGTLTVTGGTYTGGRGSSAIARLGEAYAYGGSGINFSGSALTINGGTFIAAQGGTANGVRDFDGAGILSGGDTTVNGGTFIGAGTQNGFFSNAGIWMENASLTVNESVDDVHIKGNLQVFNTANETIDIQAGQIDGNIYVYNGSTGTGTTELKVNENVGFNGAFEQYMGTVNVTLGSSTESKFFRNVDITDGDMSFNAMPVLTSVGSRFVLNGSSSLNFAQGAELSRNTSISAGYGQVTAGGDLNVGENSSVQFSFNSLTGQAGGLGITGNLILSNKNSRIIANGTSATPDGSFNVVSNLGGTVVRGPNALEDVVDVDFGWLTEVASITEVAGIQVDYQYNSLTNTGLKDIDHALLNEVDGMITNLSTSEFFALNAQGAASGQELFRYSLSQLPDASEASFQTSQQVNEQIAARGTEYRSMNGFASTKPNFGNQNRPTGVAGPEAKEDKGLQGWVRAYGSFGDKERSDNFSSYDSTTWGSVIGIDKSFENILIGIAGGFGRTDLDAGSAYQADVETYHGSIYSTIGGENLFVDLALTYGMSDTEADNDTTSDEFDSMFASLYAGVGYSIDVADRVSITPEASILLSRYEQEEYTRVGLLAGTMIDEYDTDSYLSSLGVNISTLHQMDWLNRGLAFIPEVRAHWLHEFEENPDKFTYNTGGTAYRFGIRPRDEDAIRLGLGFDLWSWKYQSTKFEFDYDALFSDTYREHAFSGKVTVKF